MIIALLPLKIYYVQCHGIATAHQVNFEALQKITSNTLLLFPLSLVRALKHLHHFSTIALYLKKKIFWGGCLLKEESKESLAAVPEEDDENQFLSMLLAGDDTFIDLDGVEHGTATLADAWNADP